MNLKDYLNTILTAGISGGIAALAQSGFNGFQVDWRHTGSTFAAGALLAVINHYRTPPGTTAIPK